MIRRAVRLLLWAVAGPVLYLVAAAIGALVPHPDATQQGAGDEVQVGLLFGPIHVDFLLPADDATRAALAPFVAAGVPVDDPRVAHLIVGWGAWEFYTTAGTFADITPRATWRAVTGDASVLRADVVGPLPDGFRPPSVTLRRAAYDDLLAAIAASATGAPVPGAGHTATDGFLEAHGRFHILRTCNTWIADMLAAAGVDIGAWTPTPYAVRIGLWRAGAG